jgi:iron complex outermembrane receptor protein
MPKPNFNRSPSFLLATAIASTIAAPMALAQGPRLEEVVVTAQKRSQAVTDIPMSIIAFTGESMADMGVQDTTDIAAFVPGMAYSDSPTGTPIYTLRGVGFNESSTQAAATVGVYVDEHAIPYPIMTRGPMLDIERVEVLKGPQGTLYGRNATGGAINFITNKPTDEFEVGVTGTYGRYEVASGEGYVSGPLTDWMRARLAVKGVSSSEGWQESVSRDDELGEQDKMSARLGLAFDLGDRGEALLTTSYWKDKSDSIAPQFQASNYANLGAVADVIRPAEPAARAIGDDATEAEWMADRTPGYDMENLTFNLTFNYELNDSMTFTSLTGYADFDDNGSTFDRAGIAGIPVSADTAPYQNGDIADKTDGFLTNDVSTVTSSIDSFSQELRVSGEHGIATWVAGVYYSENDVDSVANQSFNLSTSTNGLLGGAPPGNFPAIDNTAQQDATTYAAFASADWLIGDKLTLTTGLRYSEDRIDFKGCTADTGDGSLATFFNVLTDVVSDGALTGTAVPGGCITFDLPTPESAIGPSALIKRNLDEDSTSWRLALNYDITEETSVYTSYSRGFKSGSFPTLGASNSNQFEPVVQEQLDAYEIGFKSSLLEGAAQINGAAYYYDYTDKQLLTKISDPVFGRLFALENVDDSEVYGVEIDAQWTPLDGLTLGTAVNWMETEIGDFIGSNQLGDEINFDGSEFPFSSNWSATANATYEWDLTSSLVGMVALDVNYTGDTVADYKSDDDTTTDGSPYQYDSRFDIDSYTLMNARIGVSAADGSWRAFAWGRNITDEYYYNNVMQSTDMLVRYAGMPRTYGVTMEYNW